jgi:hypothetical protein
MNLTDEALGNLVPDFLEMTPAQRIKVRALLGEQLGEQLGAGGMMPFELLAPDTAVLETRASNSEHADEMAGATVEPFGENGPHSEALFELFENLVKKDTAYVERLKRHYELFRSLLEEEKPVKKRWSLPGRPGGGRKKRLK